MQLWDVYVSSTGDSIFHHVLSSYQKLIKCTTYLILIFLHPIAVWRGASDRRLGSHQSEDRRVNREQWYSQAILSNRGDGQASADSQHTGPCHGESGEPLEASRASVWAGWSCVQAPRNPSQDYRPFQVHQEWWLVPDKCVHGKHIRHKRRRKECERLCVSSVSDVVVEFGLIWIL